jgi:hypothetical protein
MNFEFIPIIIIPVTAAAAPVVVIVIIIITKYLLAVNFTFCAISFKQF